MRDLPVACTVAAVHRGALRLVAICVALSAPRDLGATVQCPDGTPPPCAGERRPAPPDPSRIVILPFRVTAADTLLGAGIPELLATEFTGEQGPLAVHMGTVLRAWRRAGGSLRASLAQDQMLRLAREINAGLVVDGSVVGLGSRLIVSASVLPVAGGRSRRVGPVSGPPDSLEAMVGSLASGLLGATGGRGRVDTRFHLTDSPAAMRAYLEGLAHYRVGIYARACSAFERAVRLDSVFARAALMRMACGGWIGDVEPWDSVTWQLRGYLSAQDRILLTAHLGDRYPEHRSPAMRLADLRRAADQLPESPEAQFLFGDEIFHFGSAMGITDEFALARAQLERAYALDPQNEELFHLVEIALWTGDTVLLRRIWPSFEQMNQDSSITAGYGLVAGLVLNDTAIARRASAIQPNPFFLTIAASLARLSATEAERVYRTPQRPPDPDQSWFGPGYFASTIALNTGRPSLLLPDRNPGRLADFDIALVEAGLFAGWDSAGAAAAAARLATDPQPDSATAAVAHCVRALWRQRWGQTTAIDTTLLLRNHGGACLASLELLAALREGTSARPRAEALDSMLRWAIVNSRNPLTTGMWGFENLILASAWEVLGEPARALTAVRLGAGIPPGVLLLASKQREEGRLAALLGDTAAAIRAYRRYLDFRRDAEPVLIPQRDSVRLELARLERR